MEWSIPTEWIILNESIRCIQPAAVHLFTRTAWYNLKPGQSYLIYDSILPRIGTFQQFSWILNQWCAVFTGVSNKEECCKEYIIPGRMSFTYYIIPSTLSEK